MWALTQGSELQVAPGSHQEARDRKRLPIWAALDPGGGSGDLPGKRAYVLSDFYLEIHPHGHMAALVSQSTETPPCDGREPCGD